MTEKRGRGRPPFEPTQQQRLEVEVASAFGIPQDEICHAVLDPKSGKPITGKTLRRAFATEIETGLSRWKVRIAGWLAADAAKGNTTVRIFLGKTVLGLRELNRTEVTGPNGGPVEFKRVERVVVDPQATGETASNPNG